MFYYFFLKSGVKKSVKSKLSSNKNQFSASKFDLGQNVLRKEAGWSSEIFDIAEK